MRGVEEDRQRTSRITEEKGKQKRKKARKQGGPGVLLYDLSGGYGMGQGVRVVVGRREEEKERE